MELGNFSVSLAVKDIEASKQFYTKLGFAVFMGDQSQNWLIIKNGDHVMEIRFCSINTYNLPGKTAHHRSQMTTCQNRVWG